MKTLIPLLLLCVSIISETYCQCFPLPASSCDDDIPFVCNLNGYCGQTLDVNSVTDVFDCGANSLDVYGMQTIEFLATGPVLSLTINYSNCNGANQGGGVEYGISALLTEKCDEDDETLDCASAFTQSGSITVSANAEVGETYILILTGWLGNACSFEIEVNSGADSIPGLVETGAPWQGPTEVCGFVSATYVAPEVLNAEEYIWTLPGNVIIETEVPTLNVVFDQNTPEGIFEICVTAENVCDILIDYACLDVHVSDTVELNIEMELCPGDSLSAFGNIYAAPGSYVYTASAPNGCDTVANIELITFEFPVVTAIIINDNGSANGSIALTVTGGTGPFLYNWSTGSTSSQLTGLAAGNYSLTVTDANGCSGAYDFIVNLETATTFIEKSSFISIAPNPTPAYQPITISHNSAAQVHSIEYFNLHGKLIWHSDDSRYSDQRMTLPGIGMPGMYLVRMVDDGGKVFVGKISIY